MFKGLDSPCLESLDRVLVQVLPPEIVVQMSADSFRSFKDRECWQCQVQFFLHVKQPLSTYLLHLFVPCSLSLFCANVLKSSRFSIIPRFVWSDCSWMIQDIIDGGSSQTLWPTDLFTHATILSYVYLSYNIHDRVSMVCLCQAWAISGSLLPCNLLPEAVIYLRWWEDISSVKSRHKSSVTFTSLT